MAVHGDERPVAWVIARDPRLRDWLAEALRVKWQVVCAAPEALPAAGPPQLVVALESPCDLLDRLGGEPHVIWIGPPPGRPFAARQQLTVLPRQRLTSDTLLRAASAALVTQPALRSGEELPEWLPLEVRSCLEAQRRRPWPLLLVAEPGLEARRIARWVHGGEAAEFAAITGEELPGFLSGTTRGRHRTLFVEGLEYAPRSAQRELADLLDAAGMLRLPGAPETARLIASIGVDAGAALAAGTIERELYELLGASCVHVPPLRARPEALGEIAARMLAAISTATGRAASLSAAAAARLAAHPWPGNVVELRGVLLRSLAAAENEILEPEDLALPQAATAAPPQPAAPGEELERSTPGFAETLEWVLNEIAHEVKNPLVAVRTLVRCVEEDPDPDRRVLAELAGDSVKRIDAAVERLLAYSRFEAPRPRKVPVGELLAAACAEAAAELEEREVKAEVSAEAGVGAVCADPSQAAWAIGRALAALARRSAPGTQLTLSACAPGTVRITADGDGLLSEDALVQVLGDGSAREPLAIALAREVLARNGGRLTETQNGRVALEIALPVVAVRGDEEDDDGEGKRPQAARSDRRRRSRGA